MDIRRRIWLMCVVRLYIKLFIFENIFLKLKKLLIFLQFLRNFFSKMKIIMCHKVTRQQNKEKGKKKNVGIRLIQKRWAPWKSITPPHLFFFFRVQPNRGNDDMRSLLFPSFLSKHSVN